MPKINEVIISITNRCNMRCRMCDIPSQKTEELPTSIWMQFIKDAYLIGAQTIVFSGGEPLLRDDIFELISFVKNNGMRACVTSNGLLIDEKVAQKLAQCGIEVVNISVEGPEGVHDYLRGLGAFSKAVTALENLREYKIESTIATMVSKYNYQYLPYVVELAKNYGATTIKFQPFSKIFLGDDSRADDFFISDIAYAEMDRIIKEVILLCSKYGIATNPCGYLEKISAYLIKEYCDLNSSCIAPLFSCSVNCEGKVYPCWVLTEQNNLIGNVKEQKLIEIWNSHRRFSIIERIKRDGCRGCIMSCYDNNFGADSIKTKVTLNINLLKKEGFYDYITRAFRRWKRRLKFYSAYRGSIKGIVNKSKKLFIKKRAYCIQANKEARRMALNEIKLAKQILEKEIKHPL